MGKFDKSSASRRFGVMFTKAFLLTKPIYEPLSQAEATLEHCPHLWYLYSGI